MMEPHVKSMQLLPPDYHHQIAHELVDFFHSFYRFGVGRNVFNPSDPEYMQLMNNVVMGSMCLGGLVFLILCVIVIRRCFLHVRSAYARKWSDVQSVEVCAIALLAFLAISSLSGLMGEAQVDYSTGVVVEAMHNTSDLFDNAHMRAQGAVDASTNIRIAADNLILSFNSTELPSSAFQLSIESLRLVHTSKELVDSTHVLPTNISSAATEFEKTYFLVKAATNTAIMVVVFSSFLSMAAIGWSMVLPLRFAVLLLMAIVPVSHTLIGTYLSSSMMTADFCAAPYQSTLMLFPQNTTTEYYVRCPTNMSSPFVEPMQQMQDEIAKVEALHTQVTKFANEHGDLGHQMEVKFLLPMKNQLSKVHQQMQAFNASQSCFETSVAYHRATNSFCEYGMVGVFSMWVHQMMLCLMLFIAVLVTALVYERVLLRELRSDVRYHLISSYEEGDVDHVYMPSD